MRIRNRGVAKLRRWCEDRFVSQVGARDSIVVPIVLIRATTGLGFKNKLDRNLLAIGSVIVRRRRELDLPVAMLIEPWFYKVE